MAFPVQRAASPFSDSHRLINVPVQDGSLACRVAGAGAQAILLVHGQLMDSRQWLPQLNAFPADYLLVAPDLRGHGRSTAATSTYDPAEDLLSVARHLSSGPTVVVGCDSSAATSLEAAVRTPEQVAALVLVEPLVGQLLTTTYSKLDLRAAEGFEVAISEPRFAPAVEALMSRDFALFADRAVESGELVSIDHPACELVRTIIEANAHSVGADTFAMMDLMLRDKLDRLVGITTMIITRESRTHSSEADRLRERGVTVMEHELPTEAELINIELADAFSSVLLRFVSGIRSEGAGR